MSFRFPQDFFLKIHALPLVQTEHRSFLKSWPRGKSLFSQDGPFRNLCQSRRLCCHFQKRLFANDEKQWDVIRADRTNRTEELYPQGAS